MREEDRTTLVTLELEKAHKFLIQARDMVSQSYWDIAANRYYYACFHAVTALLIHDGIAVNSHKGLIAMFGPHYVRTGKMDSTHGAFLSRMEQLRMKGDYNCIYSVSPEEILTMEEPAILLIDQIDIMLR